MALAIAGATGGVEADADSILVAKPSGLAEGDLWVITVTADCDPGDNWTDPSGWTQIGTDREPSSQAYPTMASYYKAASAGDVAGSGQTVAMTGTGYAGHFSTRRYTGFNTSTPIGNVVESAAGGGAGTLDPGDITVTDNGSIVEYHICIFPDAFSGTVTEPSGTTLIFENEAAASEYVMGSSAYIARDAGSYSPNNWGFTGIGIVGQAVQSFEVRPAAVGGATSFVWNRRSSQRAKLVR